MTNSPLNTQLFQGLADKARQTGIRQQFQDDNKRVEKFSIQLDGLLFDFSKTHINSEVVQAFMAAAEDLNFADTREQMFNGSRINCTENRAVLHTLLRDFAADKINYVEPGLTAQAQHSKQQFYALVDNFQQQIEKPLNSTIKHIVHIGIGGSVLGPKMLYESLVELAPHHSPARCHDVMGTDDVHS